MVYILKRDIYADHAIWYIFVLIFTCGKFFAVKSRLRFLWPGKLLVYIHSGISTIDFKPYCLVSDVITWLLNLYHVKSSLWSVNEKPLQYNIKYDNNKLVKIHVDPSIQRFLQRFICKSVNCINYHRQNESLKGNFCFQSNHGIIEQKHDITYHKLTRLTLSRHAQSMKNIIK